MMLLIAGRSGAGKDHLANLLRERGLSVLKSYASRPKRTEDEDTHIFITPEEVADYPEKAAYTKIGEYEYFGTKEQVDDCDIYIIDPNGIKQITKNCPDKAFSLIYVYASDDNDRRIHAVARAEDKIKEEQKFLARDEAEDEQFTEFEELLQKVNAKEEKFPECITNYTEYENNYDEEDMNAFADYLAALTRRQKRMLELVKDSVRIGMTPGTETTVLMGENNDVEVPIELASDQILFHPEAFNQFMMCYLSRDASREKSDNSNNTGNNDNRFEDDGK